jgi:hypothetical protein
VSAEASLIHLFDVADKCFVRDMLDFQCHHSIKFYGENTSRINRTQMRRGVLANKASCTDYQYHSRAPNKGKLAKIITASTTNIRSSFTSN